MTKEVKERLDRQLADIQHLIAEIDEVSARLNRAADAAVEKISTTRTTKKEPTAHDEPE